MMPGADGFELCAILKTDIRTSHIPIILLTARADQPSKLEGLRRQADDYLVKPFQSEELLARIANLLELRRRLQERYRSAEFLAAPQNLPPEPEDAFLLQLRQKSSISGSTSASMA